MLLMLVISSLSTAGAEGESSILLNASAAAGYEVTLITIASGKSDFYAIDSGVKRIALDLAIVSQNWVESLQHNFKRLECLREAFRSCQPDVVVSFLDKTNILVLLASFGLKIPIVVSERIDPREYPLEALISCLRRVTYPFARALVVQTEGVGRWARQIIRGDYVHVIPNSVSPVHRRNGQRDAGKEDHTLIAIGRMQPQKGFDLLLRAFALC